MTETRLSALDDSFLAVESANAHMHVGWAATFRPPEGGQAPRFSRAPRPHSRPALQGSSLPAATRAGAAGPERADLGRRPELRHRAARGRFRRSATSRTGRRCMSRQLPRDRPLWQLWIADQLEDGRIGVVGKAHHCMVDGIAAVELGRPCCSTRRPEPPPPDGRLAARPAPRVRGSAACSSGCVDQVRADLGLLRLPARSLARRPTPARLAEQRRGPRGAGARHAVAPRRRSPR